MSPPFQLLITTLQGGLHSDRQQRPITAIRQATDDHWQRFLSLCAEHNVSNLARSSLHNNKLWNSIPKFAQQALDDRYHNTVAWSLKLSHALEQVISAFDAADIPIIPWKGPILSQRLFDNLWTREYADLDFLIPAHSQSQAKNLLATLDYHLDQKQIAENPPSLGNHNDHCRSYHHPSSEVILEIHSKPFPSTFRFTRSVDEMFIDSTRIHFHSLSIRQLSLEDEFLLLVVHGAKHHWCQLNWLYDFTLFTQNHQDSLDWKKVNLRSHHLGILRIVKTAFALSEKNWQIPISPPYLDRPNTDSTACRLASIFSTQLQSPSSQSQLSWKFYNGLHSLLSRERYRDRLPVILSSFAYLITPNSSDRKLCHAPLPLQFCACLIRPFRLLLKYGLRLAR